MKKNSFYLPLIVVSLAVSGCRSHYQVTDVERTRVLVDVRYDATPDERAAQFIIPYQHQVDSIMSPVVGYTARYMAASRPESELSNLLSDILVWAGGAFGEKPDLSVYNIGGIRAGFAKGKVTVGDVVDVAPFENKICFLTLTGDKLLELLSQIASRGGEGVSHGVELTIADGKLASACLNGDDITADKKYRIATIDYLAQGNDGLDAFKAGTDMVSPQNEKNNLRFIIMDYFREQMAQGKEVDACIEGRIKCEK